METLIKKAIRFGNSAGVILPKGWENRKVRVELVEDSIIRDILEIFKENELLSDIIGIYLVGSYARGEERIDSDIDVLVITGETNKILKKSSYEIFLISKENTEKNITKSLYLYSIVREAKTILNDTLIREYKKKKPQLSINILLNNINLMIRINKESVEIAEEAGDKIRDGVVYSAILRLRELFMIQCILKNKYYTNKEFLKILEENESMELYEVYLRIKNDLKPKNNIKSKEVKNILKYSEKLLRQIKNDKKKQKA